MSRHLMDPLRRSVAVVAATRRRCGDGRDDLCPGVVFCDQCYAHPRFHTGKLEIHAVDEKACSLGMFLAKLFDYEPELVRLVCDMFVALEMRCVLPLRREFIAFVGPFDLMGGRLEHTVPHAACHHACSKCPPCTSRSCMHIGRPPPTPYMLSP